MEDYDGESDMSMETVEVTEEPGDETLITCISYRPILYNMAHKYFKDNRMKASTWEVVAAETGMSGKELQLLSLHLVIFITAMPRRETCNNIRPCIGDHYPASLQVNS